MGGLLVVTGRAMDTPKSPWAMPSFLLGSYIVLPATRHQ